MKVKKQEIQIRVYMDNIYLRTITNERKRTERPLNKRKTN